MDNSNQFWSEFTETYRAEPCLWDVKFNIETNTSGMKVMRHCLKN